MEFELRPDGRLRYANNSNYKRDVMIRKQMNVSSAVINEFKRIIEDSEITKEDDSNWPEPVTYRCCWLWFPLIVMLCVQDDDGRQELEVVLGDEHIAFNCAKIGSLLNVQQSNDPEGQRIFYYLVQDLKCLIFSLISMHFKIKPIP